jgi:hypothetical protein
MFSKTKIALSAAIVLTQPSQHRPPPTIALPMFIDHPDHNASRDLSHRLALRPRTGSAFGRNVNDRTNPD